MKIGIVGQGYVGTAVKIVFEKHYDVETYDLDKDVCHQLQLLGFQELDQYYLNYISYVPKMLLYKYSNYLLKRNQNFEYKFATIIFYYLATLYTYFYNI